jgi:hypothetical protein
MGGIGLGLKIEKTRPDATDRDRVHRELWELIESTLWEWVTHKWPRRAILGEYAYDQAYEGLEEGSWKHGDSSLDFGFMDMAGCCGLSCEAMYHWVDMVLAARADYIERQILGRHGYRSLDDDRSTDERLFRGPSYPFVFLGRVLYGVSRCRFYDEEDPPSIFTDEIDGALTYEQLNDKERALVHRVSLTGRCDCSVCRHLLGRAPYKKTHAAPDVDLRRLERAANALRDGDGAGLADTAARALKALSAKEWPASAEIQVLGDFLEERDASVPSTLLVGMVLNKRV